MPNVKNDKLPKQMKTVLIDCMELLTFRNLEPADRKLIVLAAPRKNAAVTLE